MSKFAFVILHYQTLNDTEECIDSIKISCEEENYHIVVVDNASPNKTGKKLKEKYSKDDRITVLLNEKNEGFARGNNVGFIYSKMQLQPDFIILLNNDTILFQKEFCKKIEAVYKKAEYAVIGPMIITADGKCSSNPVNVNPISRQEVFQRLSFVKRQQFIFKYHLCWLQNLKKKYKKSKKKSEEKRYFIPLTDVRLHGSCLIFTPIYISKFDGLDDRTFMYEEERFLQKRLQDQNMMSLYYPELLIYHKEDSSTNEVLKTNKEKNNFFFENEINSLEILLNDYKQS